MKMRNSIPIWSYKICELSTKQQTPYKSVTHREHTKNTWNKHARKQDGSGDDWHTLDVTENWNEYKSHATA